MELVGKRRVKIQSCHDLDGYRVATAEVIERDEHPPEGSPEVGAARAVGDACAARGDPLYPSFQGFRGDSVAVFSFLLYAPHVRHER